MKTVHILSFFLILTISAICQPLIVFGEVPTSGDGLTFTASEMHANEVLLTWQGDFHADDFKELIVSFSTDGETYEVVRNVSMRSATKAYTQVIRTIKDKDAYFQLAGRTVEGRSIPIRTILVPAEKTGLSVLPLKSNHLLYLTSTKSCNVAIENETGEVVLRLALKKGTQPIDISTFELGKYEVLSEDFSIPASVVFERI